ncbi:isochorismatase family protein [Ramlibacter sp. AW1]|uniref:Isochorismatase family protein n=1 Tax=Ramlibacter aurantiacus TaxID=2801330 RepID=A0A936ZLF1_9BURK|nr:isochorismatase family protein [Ramlibacter aurantiacus]MBL0421967.1 isochorismatase family protein [Ramlibacter aurantiacus]
MTNQSEQDFFRARGFGQAIGFGRSPAVLVIDMIRAFSDPAMMLGANLDDEIAATRTLLAAARKAGWPVIFSTVAYDDLDFKDAGIWALKQKGVMTLRAGTPEVELDPRLTREPGDSWLVKKYASCFFGTDLPSRLVSRGVDTLLLAGCTTSGCVRATAVDACQNGFRPMVVRECVGDRSRAAHEQSLFDLQAKYADVVGLDDACRYLETTPRPPR